jgi:hypothetical protein
LQKGIARSFTLGVVIVVIAVVGMAAIFAAGSSSIGNIVSSVTGSSSTATNTIATSVATSASYTGPAPSGFGQSVLQTHINNINARNVQAAAADFTSNGVMIWSGTTQGLGGTYTPQSNIRLTLQTAIGSASTLSYTISNFTAAGSPSNPNVAQAIAVVNFNGKSAILGTFSGTLDSTFDYINQGGTWLIAQENSNYVAFTVEYSQGATTFPQWQVTGPPLPFRYSESPFKNFVYFDGGAIAAIAIAAYLASLPLFLYVKKKRNSNRANENRLP